MLQLVVFIRHVGSTPISPGTPSSSVDRHFFKRTPRQSPMVQNARRKRGRANYRQQSPQQSDSAAEVLTGRLDHPIGPASKQDHAEKDHQVGDKSHLRQL